MSEPVWAPVDACTLPTDERPLREAGPSLGGHREYDPRAVTGCSCDPACPIPVAELDPGRGGCRTGPPPERPRSGGPLPRSDEP